jgi:hypothetical protein
VAGYEIASGPNLKLAVASLEQACGVRTILGVAIMADAHWEITLYREEAKKCEARANQFDDDWEVWLERELLWRELADSIERENAPKAA